MSFKPRFESDELKILRYLNTRWELPVENKKRYIYLEKGYAGEVLFDSKTERLKNDLHILNDLQLQSNNTDFQIDSLIILQDTLFPCEVKNYEGDYYYKNDKFYTVNGTEIWNPLEQIKRSDNLLRQLLQKNKYQFSIKSNVIFINPAFTLYHTPERATRLPNPAKTFFNQFGSETF